MYYTLYTCIELLEWECMQAHTMAGCAHIAIFYNSSMYMGTDSIVCMTVQALHMHVVDITKTDNN